MKKTSRPIDGFVSREARRPIGSMQSGTGRAPRLSRQTSLGASSGGLVSSQPKKPVAAATTSAPSKRRISRREIDESLSKIDNEQLERPKRGIFKKGAKKSNSTHRKKIMKRVTILLLLIGLFVGAFVAYRVFIAGSNVFQGNPFGVLQNKPLKTDDRGRTNVLVFGTSGSVDDRGHDGANLTDTIMVLSVDQKKKDAFMVSLPRDLYVEYGQSCPEGFRGRINSLYDCHAAGQTDDESIRIGAAALEKKVTEVTGMDIQYYAHINWAVVVGSINAIGGIDVNVEGNGSCLGFGMPEGSIVDNNMRVRYTPGIHKMNGEQALSFSRARGSAGGCGLDRGDYDRQANQQKVLKAMQEKATSAETLTNLGKVTSLIDALGENLRTNFDTSEIRTLMSLGNDISPDNLQSVDLVSAENQLIGGDMINGASVQVPSAGMFIYSDIINFINNTVYATEVTKEAAQVIILNGGAVAGYGQERASELEALGFVIAAVDNATEGTYDTVEVFDLTASKPASVAELEKKYGVTAKTGIPPTSASTEGVDIVVVYGPATSAE